MHHCWWRCTGLAKRHPSAQRGALRVLRLTTARYSPSLPGRLVTLGGHKDCVRQGPEPRNLLSLAHSRPHATCNLQTPMRATVQSRFLFVKDCRSANRHSHIELLAFLHARKAGRGDTDYLKGLAV